MLKRVFIIQICNCCNGNDRCCVGCNGYNGQNGAFERRINGAIFHEGSKSVAIDHFLNLSGVICITGSWFGRHPAERNLFVYRLRCKKCYCSPSTRQFLRGTWSILLPFGREGRRRIVSAQRKWVVMGSHLRVPTMPLAHIVVNFHAKIRSFKALLAAYASLYQLEAKIRRQKSSPKTEKNARNHLTNSHTSLPTNNLNAICD